jgi:hypothetical protein
MYIYDTPKNSTSSSSHTTPTYLSDPAAHHRQTAWSWNSERETRSDHSSTYDPHRISPHGLSSEARMSSEPGHRKTRLLQTTATQADRRRQHNHNRKGGTSHRPPQESKQSRTRSVHVLTPQDIPSWTVIRGQDVIRAQPPNNRFSPDRGNTSGINIYI